MNTGRVFGFGPMGKALRGERKDSPPPAPSLDNATIDRSPDTVQLSAAALAVAAQATGKPVRAVTVNKEPPEVPPAASVPASGDRPDSHRPGKGSAQKAPDKPARATNPAAEALEAGIAVKVDVNPAKYNKPNDLADVARVNTARNERIAAEINSALRQLVPGQQLTIGRGEKCQIQLVTQPAESVFSEAHCVVVRLPDRRGQSLYKVQNGKDGKASTNGVAKKPAGNDIPNYHGQDITGAITAQGGDVIFLAPKAGAGNYVMFQLP